MIYELPYRLFHLAAPLFAKTSIERSVIDATFEGRQPARLFVDDARHPTAALLCRTYEYYVAGDPVAAPGAPGVRRFIRDAPAEAGVFADLYGYAPLNDAWTRALLDDHRGGLVAIERRGFALDAHADTVASPNAGRPDGTAGGTGGPAPRRIDRPLAERIDREMQQYIKASWGSYEAFIDGGFGFCILVDDQLASVAFAIAASARHANVDVETAAPFRRRGLALLCYRAFIDHCREHGLTPLWEADDTNRASRTLAHRLGFRQIAAYSQLTPPHGTKIPLSHGLWAAEATLTGMTPGVTMWRRLTTS